MTRKIKIKMDDVTIEAELYDNVTAEKIWDSLPIESVGNLWGEEVYFPTIVTAQLDKTSHIVVNKGTVGYWPPSKAVCIFYGKTPVSTDTEIKAASAVNIIGKVTSNMSCLNSLDDSCDVLVTRIE